MADTTSAPRIEPHELNQSPDRVHFAYVIYLDATPPFQAPI